MILSLGSIYADLDPSNLPAIFTCAISAQRISQTKISYARADVILDKRFLSTPKHLSNARKLGHMVTKTQKAFSEDDLQKMADTYHRWREGNSYEDVAGFYTSAIMEKIAAHGYVFTPGRFVGAENMEDDGEPFWAKMSLLVGELDAQFAESTKLESAIRDNLRGLGLGD